MWVHIYLHRFLNGAVENLSIHSTILATLITDGDIEAAQLSCSDCNRIIDYLTAILTADY